MIKPMPFATASAIVVTGISFVCWVATLVAPDFAFGVASTWTHMLSLEAIRVESVVSFSEALAGFVSLGILTWISAYALSELYSFFVKRK